MDAQSKQEDIARNCRCCFRLLINNAKILKINPLIEFKFYELTQIKLISDPAYSSVICELCDSDLNNFLLLKNDLSSKQQRLYDETNQQHEEKCKHDTNELDYITIVEALDESLIEKISEEPYKHIIHDYDTVDYEEVKTVEPSRRKTPRKQHIKVLKKQRSMNDEFSLTCSDCGMSLANNLSLKRHVERIHKKIRNFQCDQCSYSAFFKHSLEKHVVKHITQEFRDRFLCDICDFVSINAVNIVLHMKYEHGKLKRSNVCSFDGCSKEFSRPGQLKAHIRLTHEKRKDKICATCSKAFSTTTRLKEHNVSAHSIAPKDFACEFCAKQFLTLRQLKNHQVYHEEPKFSCKFCNKNFYKSVLLDGHHKTHLEQKDYSCTICDQKYFLKSHLNRHIRSVHDKIKMSCELCPSKFVRKETYRHHVLKNHKGLEQTDLEALLNRISKNTWL